MTHNPLIQALCVLLVIAAAIHGWMTGGAARAVLYVIGALIVVIAVMLALNFLTSV